VTAFSGRAALRPAYTQIKEEIEWLEAAITVWKVRYNTLNITQRLPPEVLSLIFKSVAAHFHGAGCNQMEWIKITHVCTRWRRVALDCPTLWTTFSIPTSSLHPTFAEIIMERSKNMLLTVHIHIRVITLNQWQRQLIRMVLAEMSRIRELFLHDGGYREEMVQMLPDFFKGPIPLLESFKMFFNQTACIGYPLNYKLPNDFFPGQTHRLRELELQGCSHPSDFSCLSGLTTLKVSHVPDGSKPSVEQVLTGLHNMPDLENLDLCQALSSDPANTASDIPHVSLPRLTHIHIASGLRECASLVSRLIYPSTDFVSLNCTVFPSDDEFWDLSSNIPSLRELSTIFTQHQPVRHIEAQYLCHPAVIQLTTTDLSTHGMDLVPQVNLTLSGDPAMHYFEEHSREHAWSELLQTLWLSIPTDYLESLSVIQNSEFEDVWFSIFNGLATAINLKKLSVVEDSGINFLRTFSPDAPPRSEEYYSRERVPTSLPNLQVLAIEKWMFNQIADGITCLGLLRICLKDRRKRWAAIPELSLRNCRSIAEDDVVKLWDIVEELTWDGNENFEFAQENPDPDSNDEENISHAHRVPMWL
jgi:hypothetical protein